MAKKNTINLTVRLMAVTDLKTYDKCVHPVTLVGITADTVLVKDGGLAHLERYTRNSNSHGRGGLMGCRRTGIFDMECYLTDQSLAAVDGLYAAFGSKPIQFIDVDR
jgi:hypothetical protein